MKSLRKSAKGEARLSSPVFRLTANSAHVAQSVEHVLGKDEVTSSILVVGSILMSGCECKANRPQPEPKCYGGCRIRNYGFFGIQRAAICGSNSVARVTAFQAEGRGSESRLPLHECRPSGPGRIRRMSPAGPTGGGRGPRGSRGERPNVVVSPTWLSGRALPW